MVEATGNGISLFSRSSRKRKKEASGENQILERRTGPRETYASVLVEQTSLARHRDTAQSEEAGNSKELDPRIIVQTRGADPEGRSGDASTSGRTLQDEGPVTFRSLGVSEWLDR